MKKGVVIALVCLLLFSACGQQTKKPENSGEPPETVGPAISPLVKEDSSLYYSSNNGSEDVGAKNTESNEERLVRIVRNVCADLYHTTQKDGLQIRQPEYQGNECHIYTYAPGNTGPTLFVEFIFDIGGNEETAIANFWGERTEFRLSDYDTAKTTPSPSPTTADEIEQIQRWYAQTDQNASKLEGEVFGTSACAYWLDGELVKAEYYVVTDVLDGTLTGTGYTLTCYYHGATPYYAHVVGYGKSADLDVILYFWDGKIIRWFGKDGQHEGSNEVYEEYYKRALEEYYNVQSVHGSGVPLVENAAIGDYETIQGCRFYIPEGFVLTNAARASTGLGYEYSFYHAELDMTIYLYEFYTEGYGISGTEWMEKDYFSYAGDNSVTYFPKGDNWFVASGYSRDGAWVYYTRVYGVQSFYYRYTINYPTANKGICDQMVGDFAKSFTL